METAEKLALLAASARYDASCASSGSARRGALGAANAGGVCHAWTEDGRCVSLLKVLLSNRCRYDCAYCANRASAEVPRASFETDELVRIVVSFYRRNYIEGLFLSSGVFAEPDTVMERMNEVARRLRRDEGFGGYIHLKAIPGAGERTLAEAGFLADRLSANIELPTARALASLAPDKDGRAIVGMMRSIDGRIREDADGRRGAARRPRAWAPAGQSTQLVVGASPDSDREIVALAGALYREVRLRRVYYSAYLPVSTDPRLPGSPPPLLREHRLYQADWLVRRYGFSTGEILEDDAENLDPDLDPKSAWALRHLDRFPVELAKAPWEELLRVPGIGATGACRILESRRAGGLSLEALPSLGIVMKRARWFVTVRGRAPAGAGTDLALPRLRALISDRPAPRGDDAPGSAPAVDTRSLEAPHPSAVHPGSAEGVPPVPAADPLQLELGLGKGAA